MTLKLFSLRQAQLDTKEFSPMPKPFQNAPCLPVQSKSEASDMPPTNEPENPKVEALAPIELRANFERNRRTSGNVYSTKKKRCFTCSLWRQAAGLAWWCGVCSVSGKHAGFKTNCSLEVNLC